MLLENDISSSRTLSRGPLLLVLPLLLKDEMLDAFIFLPLRRPNLLLSLLLLLLLLKLLLLLGLLTSGRTKNGLEVVDIIDILKSVAEDRVACDERVIWDDRVSSIISCFSQVKERLPTSSVCSIVICSSVDCSRRKISV